MSMYTANSWEVFIIDCPMQNILGEGNFSRHRALADLSKIKQKYCQMTKSRSSRTETSKAGFGRIWKWKRNPGDKTWSWA